MYKFFSSSKSENYFFLDEDTQKHLKVIRIKNQDFLINFNNEFYLCYFEFPNKAIIKKKLNIDNELEDDLIVAIPLIKQNNFEIALQKSVELGVTKIIPFISEYTDKTNMQIESKIKRFKKIILEASQQSFRNTMPIFERVMTYDEIIKLDVKNKILAYENEKDKKITKRKGDTLLIVGPEGGFSLNEIELAKKENVEIVSLTKTILRAETALIYMIAKMN
ncbi:MULTISPECIES: 16S rRNA (uracil(1498)-N(3))-methyltransferase [unclassified Mycoplasma]|uniref:16S rRNA (uracil(1498)-N(3))-methyltransferase n=1 Tax=Mycoplasma sp. 125 TaxID=3447505 RepID=UPI003F65B01B